MSKNCDVLVVGAGITGLAVAALLAQSRHRQRLNITVADAGPRPAFDAKSDVALRVSAIATGSDHTRGPLFPRFERRALVIAELLAGEDEKKQVYEREVSQVESAVAELGPDAESAVC